MKLGKSLQELAAEIERRAASKKDFVAPSGKLEVVVHEDKPAIQFQNGQLETFEVNGVAHEQIAEYTGIPLAYYRRLNAEDPQLLATNVNRWLHDQGKAGERRLVRTLDGKARALLSDKYRALDYEELGEAILPVLLDLDLLIVSCEITEKRLYIKAVDRAIERSIPKGAYMGDGGHTIFDTVAPAINIRNSEVGYGALSIETGTLTKACTNLAWFGASMKKYHTGARAAVSDEVFALLTDETKRLTDAAVWAQTRDLVKGAFDAARFDQVVSKLTDASRQKLPDDVVQVVEKVGRKFQFNDGERKGILARLIEGGDLSRYGLHSAVTRHSADVPDYDRATELEGAGARIIELPQSEWQELAKAA